MSGVDVPKRISTRNGRPALCVVSSDKSGHFVFPSLPPGDFELVSVVSCIVLSQSLLMSSVGKEYLPLHAHLPLLCN